MKTPATKPAVSAKFSSAEYLRRLMTELDRAAICRRIAKARDDAGLKQPELGNLLNVHWRTVQVWERGESIKSKGIHRWTVPWDRLSEIAEATGVTKEWLLHGDEQPAAPVRASVTDDELRARLDRIEQQLELLVAQFVLRTQRDRPNHGHSDPQNRARSLRPPR